MDLTGLEFGLSYLSPVLAIRRKRVRAGRKPVSTNGPGVLNHEPQHIALQPSLIRHRLRSLDEI